MEKQDKIEVFCQVCSSKIIRKYTESFNCLSQRKTCSRECNYKYNSGKKHWAWKGESVTKTGKHSYIINNHGSANKCENREEMFLGFPCKRKSIRYHYAIKHGREYSKNINDYYSLCVSCHKKYDIKGKKVISSTQFKKGMITWNKGIPMRPEMKEKMMTAKLFRKMYPLIHQSLITA